MGARVVNIIMALNVAAIISYIVGMTSRHHSIGFFAAGGGVRMAQMYTYLLTVDIETTNSGFCRAVERLSNDNIGGSGQWCKDLGSSNDIQDTQQRMCSEVWRAVWPGFCDGLGWAYSLGLILFLVLLLQIIVNSMVVYLLYEYSRNKAKKQYRKTSMYLMAIGTAVTILCIFMYSLLALGGLGEIEAANGLSWFSFVLSVSKGVGFCFAHVMMWLGPIMQLIALGLISQGKISDEDLVYEISMQKRFDREQDRFFAGQEEFGVAGYGATDGNRPLFGYFNTPGMQPSFGMPTPPGMFQIHDMSNPRGAFQFGGASGTIGGASAAPAAQGHGAPAF